MSWEQRNADFCKAQLDAEFVYIEAERRVKALEDENAKLRELVRDMWSAYHDGATNKEFRALPDRLCELGVDV